MATIIQKENEELFFPNGFWKGYAISIGTLLFIIGLFFVYMFIDELINANYDKYYFIKLALLLFFFFLAPVFDVFKRSKKIYVNFFDRYFRIENQIIPFDNLVYIKYNYGILKPLKYTLYSTVFYFVLKNGEKVRFCTFFKGTDKALIREFTDLNFNIQKCSFRDL